MVQVPPEAGGAMPLRAACQRTFALFVDGDVDSDLDSDLDGGLGGELEAVSAKIRNRELNET